MRSLSPTRVSPKISSDKTMNPQGLTMTRDRYPPRPFIYTGEQCHPSSRTSMHHVSTSTCPSTLSISQALHFISVIYWDSVLARERGERRTAPIIFKHLSHNPTPTPPQDRTSFHTHENLQAVKKLLLKPLDNSYELLQSYQSKNSCENASKLRKNSFNALWIRRTSLVHARMM